MYFINEKAGTMATVDPVNLETGLPALYRAQKEDSSREIIIWRDGCGNVHAETTYSDTTKIMAAIQKFKKGEDYLS